MGLFTRLAKPLISTVKQPPFLDHSNIDLANHKKLRKLLPLVYYSQNQGAILKTTDFKQIKHLKRGKQLLLLGLNYKGSSPFIKSLLLFRQLVSRSTCTNTFF